MSSADERHLKPGFTFTAISSFKAPFDTLTNAEASMRLRFGPMPSALPIAVRLAAVLLLLASPSPLASTAIPLFVDAAETSPSSPSPAHTQRGLTDDSALAQRLVNPNS